MRLKCNADWSLDNQISEGYLYGTRQRYTYHLSFRGLRRPAVQGSQYAAWLHPDLLHIAGVHISMSDTGKPQQNCIAERFMRTLKEEHVDYTEYTHFDDACQQLARWLHVEYNTYRVHSALGYATPAESERAAVPRAKLNAFFVQLFHRTTSFSGVGCCYDNAPMESF